MKVLYRFLLAASFMLTACTASTAQDSDLPLLPDNDHILLTVFLKHDQSMNNVQRRELLETTTWRQDFPVEGTEIIDHYVMMGIGQVIVIKLPPNLLRAVNRAIEHSAWGAYQTEFYITYDLAAARAAQNAQ